MTASPPHLVRLLLLGALGATLTACPEPEPDDPPLEVAEGIYAVDGLGSPVGFATETQLATFARGEAIATHRFTEDEGLGPRFNVTFCASCHEGPVPGGGAPRYRDFYISGTELADHTFIVNDNDGIVYGYQLDNEILRPNLPDDINVRAMRNGIPFFGVGLIAEIYEEAILANVDEDDADGDGISGRANWDQGFVGRFGVKAQTVSIEGFIRGPINNHLGITSDPLSEERRSQLPVDSSDPDLLAAELMGAAFGELRTRGQAQAAAPSEPLFDEDDVPDPEMSADDLFDLVSWAMLLAAPGPPTVTEQSERGRALFEDANCVGCHVPALEAPRGLIPLYSDLLLHDMGEDMADGIVMGLARAEEFRTQPLWGVAANSPYLHDGRADTLEQAIQHHGGEAAQSRDAFLAMSAGDQADLVAFLNSLGAADEATDGLLVPGIEDDFSLSPVQPREPLEGDDLARFIRGMRVYDRDQTLDAGLGPTFNGDSCRACHFEPVIGGAGPLGVNVTRTGTWTDEGFMPPENGTMLHRLGTWDRDRPQYGEGHNTLEWRQTPTNLGLGLIDSIPDEAILANEDPDDLDGDGIRGVARVLADGRVGRLGWRAGVPSVRDFVRDAMSNEMGVTVPEESGPVSFGNVSDGDDTPDPELTHQDMDDITYFIQMLPAPEPLADHPEGRAVFEAIGCNRCHIPELPGADGPVPLYSDLLLHAVGPTDRASVPDEGYSEQLYRTPPLWGISQSGPYMHDGTAFTIEDAIERHQNEAQLVIDGYHALSDADHTALITFLEAL